MERKVGKCILFKDSSKLIIINKWINFKLHTVIKVIKSTYTNFYWYKCNDFCYN